MASKVARKRKASGSRERLTEIYKHRNAYGWGEEKTNEGEKHTEESVINKEAEYLNSE